MQSIGGGIPEMFFWTHLLLFSTFAVPQLLGVLLYFRLSRWRRLAFTLGILTPVILFFFLSPLFFFAGLREAAARGELTCGMPALAAAFMVLAGSVVQLVVAFIIQLWLFKK